MIKVFEPCITKEDLAIASEKCLATGQFDPGQYVDQFEAEIAKYLGVPASWVMVTNSCTAALGVCYHFLVGGKTLQAPVYTWPGTYCTIRNLTLYDKEPNDRDPAVVVDLFGSGEFVAAGSPLIIDAAHNCLSKELIRRYLLTGIAAAVCCSFGPTKQLTTIRGGVVVSPEVSGQWRAFIHYGAHERQPIMAHGANCTMPDFNACIGLNQLKRFDKMQAKRKELLRQYEARVPATVVSGDAGHIMAIDSPYPDRVRRALASAGIQTSHHYPLPARCALDYPDSLARSNRQITLPLHLNMTSSDIDLICSTMERLNLSE